MPITSSTWSRVRSRLVAGAAVTALGLGTLAATGASGQPKQDHVDRLARLAAALERKLPDARTRVLSSGAQQLIEVGRQADRLKPQGAGLQAALQEVAAESARRQRSARGLAGRQVNDPFAPEDLASRLLGSTQSETTAAWCGDAALAGYNDSGSFVATLFFGVSPSGSLSFNGWSRSADRGTTFTDQGPLLADPLPEGVTFRDLLGDPLVNCTTGDDFYYGSLATDFNDDDTVDSGISVSHSADGGQTFGPAVMAAEKDADLHFLDKPWMDAEPGPTPAADDDILHVTYTDFDFSSQSATCGEEGRTAIEYVRSDDSGQTWTEPLVIDEVCGFESFVQGSQVEAGPGDVVYVAWERYEGFETRDIRIRRSSDLGASFAAASVIDSVTPIGDGFLVQGGFRAFLDLQGLAVDESTKPSTGTVYVTWHDGRNNRQFDPAGACGGEPVYCFGDILFARSSDEGATWSRPVRVNDDDPRLGIDQHFPALTVDGSGTVWTTFYDKRRDPRNLLIDTFVGKSTNRGARWTNRRVTRQAFPAIIGEDLVVNPVYMGDYNAIEPDQLGQTPGVLVVYGDNSLGDPNVVAVKRR